MPELLPTPAQQKARTLFVIKSDEAIITAVNRYHLATADQLCRFLLGSKSYAHMRSKASHLADAGYLLRNEELRPLGPVVYSLGPKGRSYLRELGVAVPERLKKTVVRHYGWGHLNHALGVTDILIAADLVAQRTPHVRLAALFNEHALKRKGVRVSLPAGGTVTVCPDAWLDFRLEGDRWYRSCLSIEFDRGNEWQPAWREKVRAILAWAKGPYITAFGTESLSVAVIVDAGEQSAQRCQNLLRWTEAELVAQHAQHEADLFCIAALNPATADPVQLFLGPLFQSPFAPEPTPLLAVPQAEA
jgi:hypothetical protein